MHPPCRTGLPAPKGAAAGQGGQGPSPALVPARMREQTRHVAHHLAHHRSCLERVEAPRLPTPTLEPTPFQDTEADDTACVYSLQIRTRGCGGSRIKTRTASFVWSDVFVLPPLHGKDCLGTRSSTSRTNSVASTSGLEDGEVVEPGSGSGSGSESVCVVRKPKREQSQPQTSTTDHVTGSYFPSVRPEPPLASNYDPTTPADFEPPSPTTVAQPGYHKAQMSKVLKRARKELMKGVRKAGYNALGVEGFSRLCFFFCKGGFNSWYFGTGGNSPFSVKTNAAALKSSTELGLLFLCPIRWRICGYHIAHRT